MRIERGKNTEGGEWLLCDVNIIKLRMFICLHVNNDKKTMSSSYVYKEAFSFF